MVLFVQRFDFVTNDKKTGPARSKRALCGTSTTRYSKKGWLGLVQHTTLPFSLATSANSRRKSNRQVRATWCPNSRMISAALIGSDWTWMSWENVACDREV